MIELQLNEKFVTLPESWDEVTLEQYVNILNARLDKMLSRVKVKLKTISIFANDDSIYQMLMHLESEDLNDLLANFAWIDIDPDYAKIDEQTEMNINGKRFRIKSNYNKLEANEVIAIEELTQNEKVDLHHFEIAFGVLFRELDEYGVEKELTLESLFEQIKEFRSQVYLKDVFGVLAFFLFGDKESFSKTSKSCSTHQAKKVKMTLKKTQTK